MGEDCLFCKIAAGQMDTEFLRETDSLVVFKDIHPQAPVHLLIVPKKHIRSINDLEEEDRGIVADLLFTARKMAADQGIDKSGYRLFFNVERGGGQLVFHLHLHLIGGWK
ncbi:MAG: histidine triad nucleotide-binding protein [Deltaproteobacteria bacterium]|nr:histidine triad nucleotide-binding protein [Deltaproteobacteria bacterium]